MTTQADVGKKSRRWLVPAVATLVIVACGVAGFFYWAGRVRVPSNGPITVEVARAAVAGDWATVARLLEPVNDKTESPVPRILKAHALLATNRNNESQCLFLGASTPQAQDAWLNWAQEFERLNPKQGTAHFLAGDAYARRADWKSAIVELDAAVQALEQKRAAPTALAVALNVRGTVLAATHDYRRSLGDLQRASELNKSLADPYANRGALVLAWGEGKPESASQWFAKALQIAGNHWVARYGQLLATVRAPSSSSEEIKARIASLREEATSGCFADSLKGTLAWTKDWLDTPKNPPLPTSDDSSKDPGTFQRSSVAPLKNDAYMNKAAAEHLAKDGQILGDPKNLLNPAKYVGAAMDGLVALGAQAAVRGGIARNAERLEQGYKLARDSNNPKTMEQYSHQVNEALNVDPHVRQMMSDRLMDKQRGYENKAASLQGGRVDKTDSAALTAGLKGLIAPGVVGNLEGKAAHTERFTGSTNAKSALAQSRADNVAGLQKSAEGGASNEPASAPVFRRGDASGLIVYYGPLYAQLQAL